MKKYCILGNCQANALASTLQVCAEFKRTYAFQRVTPIHRITQLEQDHFLNEILPQTDLFAYQPISESYRGGGFGFNTALSNLTDRTKAVSYPSIQFYGYHASARTQSNWPEHVFEQTREIFGLAGGELFHFSQVMMAFLQGLPLHEAREVFHNGYDGDAEFVQKRCTQSLRQLRESEEQFDITARLHDKIFTDYKTSQLFWSPRHPTGELLTHISLIILERIGITPTEKEIKRMSCRDPLKLPQYPMPNFVHRVLELEFEGMTTFKTKTMNLELDDFIQACYVIYAAAGRDNVIDGLNSTFANLQSWKNMRVTL
jgi:hypothetical protein